MDGSSVSHHVVGKKKENYFGKLKFALKLAGVSLDGNDSLAYKVYSCLLFLFINFLYTLLDTVEMFKYDFETVINFITFPIGIIVAFGKTVVFMRKRIQIGKLLDKLEHEPFLPNHSRGGEEEEKLLKSCLRIINAQTTLYWLSTGTTVTLAFLFTITTRIMSSDYRDWKFSYGPFTTLNVTYSPNYEISAFYQDITLLVIGIQFSTFDLMITGIFAYISFQFKILQNFFRHIVEISYVEMLKETSCENAIPNPSGSDEIDGSLIPWKYLKKHLAQGVNYHSAIISVADEMEDLFKGLFLLEFVTTMGMMSTLVFHAASPDGLWWLLSGVVGIVGGQLFMSCFWAEQVMHESQEVGRAVYESNFVGTDLRFQKSLILIIRRSQNPTVLTAGKFAVVGLSTFAWILKTIYSTSTVLKQVVH